MSSENNNRIRRKKVSTSGAKTNKDIRIVKSDSTGTVRQSQRDSAQSGSPQRRFEVYGGKADSSPKRNQSVKRAQGSYGGEGAFRESPIRENPSEFSIGGSKKRVATAKRPKTGKKRKGPLQRMDSRNFVRDMVLSVLKKALVILLILVALAGVGGFGYYKYATYGMPQVTKELLEAKSINPEPVSSKEIPKDLKDAIVATEDERFRSHNGVDYKSLIRAFISTIFMGRREGGSTIEMQLSKNLLTGPQKTIKRKMQDIHNALQMDSIMTKDEILTLYLNNIYLGKNTYGVEGGAALYFKKDVKSLNLPQCAMLAGITNNPAKYQVYGEAKKRQRLVLSRMYENGYITEEQFKDARMKDVPFRSEID